MRETWNIRFGTAGTSDSFAAQGYKSSLDVPEYTAKMGLNAFEYQCGRGVRLGLDKAAKMAALAGPKDILFSVHAPYYISMSSLEEEKRLNSIQYLLQSAAVCKALGGRRIIFHSGSCGKQSREAALEKALDTMRRAVEALDEAGFADMTLCPETMVLGIFLPIILCSWHYDWPILRHKGLICMALDTVLSYLMVFFGCLFYVKGVTGVIIARNLWVLTVFSILAWGIFIVFRYIRCSRLMKTGITVTLCGVWMFFANTLISVAYNRVVRPSVNFHNWMDFGGQNFGLVVLIVGAVIVAASMIRDMRK